MSTAAPTVKTPPTVFTRTQLGAIAYASGLLAQALKHVNPAMSIDARTDLDNVSRLLTSALRSPEHAALECYEVWQIYGRPDINAAAAPVGEALT
ncbi:hypothetical protein [Nanchangia anserum]|uniref:Uncharacterized protein n=1 Tax=Nanchangia anserum TaxID=2692125 RepID=A0A8I0GBQ8_9ACTO|nr:hypothetical protein [Nanchangia anserum]MBD3689848.1 hypothetical protein [Nanchangia anserum]